GGGPLRDGLRSAQGITHATEDAFGTRAVLLHGGPATAGHEPAYDPVLPGRFQASPALRGRSDTPPRSAARCEGYRRRRGARFPPPPRSTPSKQDQYTEQPPRGYPQFLWLRSCRRTVDR